MWVVSWLAQGYDDLRLMSHFPSLEKFALEEDALGPFSSASDNFSSGISYPVGLIAPGPICT